jgi:hypothetical protein
MDNLYNLLRRFGGLLCVGSEIAKKMLDAGVATAPQLVWGAIETDLFLINDHRLYDDGPAVNISVRVDGVDSPIAPCIRSVTEIEIVEYNSAKHRECRIRIRCDLPERKWSLCAKFVGLDKSSLMADLCARLDLGNFPETKIDITEEAANGLVAAIIKWLASNQMHEIRGAP